MRATSAVRVEPEIAAAMKYSPKSNRKENYHAG
jgi:hypothetical protein